MTLIQAERKKKDANETKRKKQSDLRDRLADLKKREVEKKKKTREQEAFLQEQEKEIQEEKNQNAKTKRLIKTMNDSEGSGTKEIKELLTNFQGNTYFREMRFILTSISKYLIITCLFGF